MEELAAETVRLPRPCAAPRVRPSPPLSSCEYHSTAQREKKTSIVCEIFTSFE